ncbi:glycoside hydrolase family 88 protein [Paenibacillus sp. MSJ-34]|uniref:glycoside hydrolase family 88 protein n=1 Tax=Paenibacillus sp. MSJ-34 TaxID=2841529 RepID=UPI001C1196A0|nr:glycoside hydrolase family 88 protein [Paenibacillus sp. MSJ-34]MBU5442178.1 glycoside hydrolase family 88 protein [Paenibacillus sp. MSJ-34]
MEEAWVSSVWERLLSKIDGMKNELQHKSPHTTVNGVYDDMRLDWWTSGFWPGILWIVYDMTKDESYREAAWGWDERIEQCFVKPSNLHHDVGFQFLPTAVIKYKLTNDEDGCRRGLAAANFLAGRFNPAGKFLRAWNQEMRGWSIIDSMMNLSILFWAAEQTGDPRFRHIATAHADTVLRCFARGDGTVCHIASFDPETGAFIEALGGQGYAPDSAWSRGQAWALYGLANAYRYTGEQRYLRAAQLVAHYFLAALPEDGVPPWDFRVPAAETEPKDTSAAACAASGMLEIAASLPEQEACLYRNGAVRMLRALADGYATWDEPEQQGILRGGTGNKPAGQNVNVSLIYGDYFFAEAIAKLKGWENRIF